MLKIPDESMFPGTGPGGNGMPTTMLSQANWVGAVKQSGCGNCHQAGGAIMRSLDYEALGVENGTHRQVGRRDCGGDSPAMACSALSAT